GAVLPAVVRAAALGESDAPIPAGLRPPVGKLAEAFYMPPAGCAAADGETSSRLCRLGRPRAAQTIAVLGDSHSRMWMPAILALARHDGWAVVPLEKDTCGLTQWGLPTAECDTWFRWALRQVEALRPQVTLVAGRYSGHYGTGPILGPRTLAGMRRLVAALGPTPTQVVLVEDPPGVASDPVNCLLGRHATTRTCTTTFADADLEADRALSDRLASLGRVELLPTRGWFCAGHTCPLVVGDTIAYLDTNHVTVPYVTELAASFRVAFAHALAARAPRDPGHPAS
ncbi:MAG TPA: SGNH hydrolase domain-containing protein, partial [Gaiellaceae bacterium]